MKINFNPGFFNRSMPIVLLLSLFNIVGSTGLNAQVLSEDFDNISGLTGSGWTIVNNSNPIGAQTSGWFQGNTATIPAYSTTGYAGANFQSSDGTPGSEINAWLVTPVVSLSNGSTLTFYARTVGPNPAVFPDNLEIRVSTNGASSNVGSTSSDVGDFTNLQLEINPTLSTTGFPDSYTLYTVTLSGIASPTTGRIAFRYHLPNADANADYVGVDEMVYTPFVAITCPGNISINSSSDGVGNCTAATTWTIPTGSAAGGAIAGYTFMGFFNGNAYYISNASTNYADAETNAAIAGGQLAIIDNAAENAALAGFLTANGISGGASIGFNDIVTEGQFVSQLGLPYGYNNWNPGEPNNSGNEDAAQILPSGGWNDYPTSSTMVSILEIGVTQTAGIMPGGLFPVGVTTNTYENTNNASICSFTVTVTDDESPTCPAAVEFCEGATVALGSPADNCGIATATNDAPAIFPVGNTTVNWVLTDVNGNVTNCTQTVNIIDTPPAPTAPAVSVASCGLTATLNATGTGGTLNWYNVATGGTSLGTGTSFVTPPITSTTTFYVDETALGTPYNLSDNFDTGFGAIWQSTQNMATNTACGSVSGLAAHANGNGSRDLTTIPINAIAGGTITFDLIIGNGGSPCEQLDPGEDVFLQYNVGAGWVNINQWGSGISNPFTNHSLAIPVGAQSTATQFRLIQPSNSGSGFDNWAIDNFTVSATRSCPGPRTAVVVSVQAPTASGATVCSGGSATLTAVGSNDIRWYADAGLTNLVSTGSIFITPALTATTNYYATSRNPNTGCETDATTVTVTVTSLPAAPTAINDAVCAGNPTTTLGVSGTTGTVNWWTSQVGGNLVNTGTTYIHTPMATTTYYVSQTLTGCTSASPRTPVTVTVNQAPTANNSPLTVCQGATLATGLTASSPSCIGSTPTPIVSISGTLSVTDPTFHRSVSGNVYSAGGGNSVFYDTYNIQVTTTGTYSIVYCGAPTQYDTHLSVYQTAFNAATPAVNFVRAADDGGPCYGLSTFMSITLTAGIDYILVANSFNNGSVGDYTITYSGPGQFITPSTAGLVWFDLATAGTQIGAGSPFNPVGATGSGLPNTNTPGTYTYYVACSSSPTCRTAASVVVTATPTAPVASGATICAGSSTTLTATGANDIRWYADAAKTNLLNTGSTFTTPSLNATTSYYVTSFNTATGCESPVTTVTVTVSQLPILTCPANITGVCEGAIVNYTFPSPPPVNSPVTLTQTTNNTVVNSVGVACIDAGVLDGANSFLRRFDISAMGYPNGVVLNSVTFGVENCNQSTSVVVNAYTLSGALTYANMTLIGTATTTIPVGSLYLHNVSMPSTIVPAGSILVLEYVVPGNGTLAFFPGANSNGQTDLGYIASANCGLNNPGSFASVGFANTHLLLHFNASPIVVPTLITGLASGSVFPVGTTTVTYQATNTTGCQSSCSFDVTVNPAPTAAITGDLEICTGQTTTLTASGGTGYVWSDGSTLATSNPITTAGTYTVTVTNAAGCTSTASANVIVNPLPTAPVVAGTTICSGGMATLTAIGANDIRWYADAAMTNLLTTGSTFTTPSLSANTDYYVTSLNTTTGCESVPTMVTVTVSPLPAAPVAIPQVICGGNPTSTLGVSGTTGTVNWWTAQVGGTMVNTGTTYIHSPMVTTTYYVSQTIAGCTSARTPVQVFVFPEAMAKITGNLEVCTGSSTTLSGSPALGYEWSNGDLTGSITVSAAGIYILTITDDNGCTATDAVEVTLIPLPTAPTVPAATVCFGGSAVLNATGANDIRWYADAAKTNLLNTGSTFTTPSLNATTSYYVTSFNTTTGCESTVTTVTVTVTPLPAAPIAVNEAVCAGNPTTTFGVSGTTGTANWFTAQTGGNLVNTGTTYIFTPTATTTFWVEQTVTGCTSSPRTAVTVTVNPLPMAAITGDLEICNGETTVLTASGGTGYVWSTGATTAAINVTFSGTYTVTVTSAAGCTASASRTVIVNPLPTAPTVPAATVCFGGSTVLNATGANDIRWYADAGKTNLLNTGSTFTTPGLTATTSYYVTSFNTTTGCESTVTTVTVTVTPLPAAPTAINDAVCAGNATTVLGVSGTTGTVNWFTAQTGGNLVNTGTTYIFTPTATTTFWVEQTVTGCTSSPRTAVTVTVNPLPTPSISGDLEICNGETTVLTASGGTGYVWSTGATTAAINVTVSGTYVVTVTSAAGCTASASRTVIVNPLPTAPTVPAATVCFGGSAVLNATGANDIRWYADATMTNLLNTGSTFTTPSLTATTSYYVTSFNTTTGCESTVTTVTVTVTPLPAAPTAINDAVCAGNATTVLGVSGTTGTVNWFTAQVGGNLVNTGTTYIFTPTATTTFWVEQTVTGCTSSPRTAVTVTVNPLPTPSISGDLEICNGETTVLTASGGTGYVWSTGATTAAINVTVSGTYVVTVTSAAGCTASASRTVIVNPLPTAPTVPAATVCFGGSAVLNATGANDIRWYADATMTNLLNTGSTFTTPSLTASTSYYVTSFNTTTGCESTVTTVTVTVTPLPAAPIAVNEAVCAGNPTTTFGVSGTTGTVNWFTAQTGGNLVNTGTTYIFTPTATTTFWVEQTVTGCTSSPRTAVTVTVNPLPTPSISGDLEICNGETTVLTASGGTGYVWSTGITIAAINVTVSGTYVVTVTSAAGCTASTSRTVIVNPLPTAPTVPAVTVCFGGSTVLNATGANDIRWYADAGKTNLLNTGSTFTTPSLTASTSYYVTSFNTTTGCESTVTTVTVTVTPLPAAPTAINDAVCAGNATTVLGVSGTTGTVNWFTAQTGGNLVNTGTTYIFTPTATTTFWVEQTVTGCTSSPRTAVTVTVNPLPMAAITGDLEICNGETTVLTASGGTGYVWSTGATTAAINVTVSGTYVVTVTSAAGCTASTSRTVIVNPLPTAPTVPAATVCFGGSAVLNATGANDIRWYADAGKTNLLNTGSTFTTPSLTATTSYYVTSFNTATGCESTVTTITVTVTPLPAAPTAINDAVCAGNATTVLGVSGTTGTVNWFTAQTGGNLVNTGTTYIFTPTATTTFWVEQTVTGCTSSPRTAVTVTVNPLPTPSISGDLEICNGETTVLTASGGTGYVWSTGATTAAINVTVSGTYTVTVSSAAGCTSTASTDVIVLPNPVATISTSGPTTFCQGGSVTLGVPTAAQFYTWTTPSGTTNASSVTATTSGDYIVLLTFPTGCTATDTVTVTVNPTPSVSITADGPTSFCAVDTVNLIAVGNGTFVWNTTETNDTISVSTSGIYTVTITDANGCTASASQEVIVYPIPAVSITADGPVTFCDGNDVNLTASMASAYQWSNGSTTQTINVTVGGTYTVLITDANGCTGTASIDIFVNPNPAVPVLTSNSPVCEGSDINLFANAPSLMYNWTGPNGFTSTDENPVITNASETQHQGIYHLTVADSITGCSTTAIGIFVEIHPVPSAVSINNDGPICSGSTLTLTALPVAGATYNWSDPSGTALGSTATPSFAINNCTVGGLYSVNITVNGCTSLSNTTNVIIKAIPAAPVVNNDGPICEGESATVSASTLANATYLWSGPNGFTSTQQNIFIPTAGLSDAGSYSCVVNVNGCNSPAASTTLVVNALPTLATNPTSNSPVCQGNDIILDAPSLAGTTYDWTGPNGIAGNTASVTISNVNPIDDQGFYTLEITNTATGCTSLPYSLLVEVNAVPDNIAASYNGPVCEGSPLVITAPSINNANYTWNGPNGFTSNNRTVTLDPVVVTDGGLYSLTVTVDGCSSIPVDINAVVYPAPIADAGQDITTLNGIPVVLGASGGISYEWTPASFLEHPNLPNPIVDAPTGVYTYTVVVFDANGCTASDDVVLTVEANNDARDLPNLITPNGDGRNDTWVSPLFSTLNDYTLSIYARGGTLLLQTSNYQNDWNATFEGSDLPEGAYWFVIRQPNKEDIKGAITVKR